MSRLRVSKEDVHPSSSRQKGVEAYVVGSHVCSPSRCSTVQSVQSDFILGAKIGARNAVPVLTRKIASTRTSGINGMTQTHAVRRISTQPRFFAVQPG